MRRLTALLLVCLCLWARPGGAQDARPEEARELFLRGVAEARAGHWQLAMVAFHAAFELQPRPGVLFNLASAQQRCGKLLASSANFRRFVASQDPSIGAVHRRTAQALVESIEARIPRLRVQIEGVRDGDLVLLDGHRLYPEELGRDLWLDPGAHTVRVERPRSDQEVRTFAVVEGQVRVLAFRLP